MSLGYATAADLESSLSIPATPRLILLGELVLDRTVGFSVVCSEFNGIKLYCIQNEN